MDLIAFFSSDSRNRLGMPASVAKNATLLVSRMEEYAQKQED